MAASPYAYSGPTTGMQLPIAGSAHGRVLLASIDDSTREQLARELMHTGDRLDESMVRHIRERGFAMMSSNAGATAIRSVAVPVLNEGRVIATLDMTFFARVVSADGIRGYHHELIAAAAQIGAAAAQLKLDPPDDRKEACG